MAIVKWRMKIDIKDFGKILVSHPAGREAFLRAKAYLFQPLLKHEDIIFDFAEVDVLTPSWAEEFIYQTAQYYAGHQTRFINTENLSVKESLAILEDIR
jgi:hypothetical protein